MNIPTINPIWLFFLMFTMCIITQTANENEKINVHTLFIMVPHIADDYSVV
jgi:hypothetical protein